MVNTWVNTFHKQNPKGPFHIWQLSFLLQEDFPPFWWSFVSWKVIQMCDISEQDRGAVTHVHSTFPVSAHSCSDMYKENVRWGCQALQAEELARKRSAGDHSEMQLDHLASRLSPSRGGAYLWYHPGSELIASQGFSPVTSYSPLSDFKDHKSIPRIGWACVLLWYIHAILTVSPCWATWEAESTPRQCNLCGEERQRTRAPQTRALVHPGHLLQSFLVERVHPLLLEWWI